ncbi:MAG: nitroreductase family deazaflavin-dependent oxidoreductase [Chloroflexi bacterium]|nr:nitroreductase family deazaflavin-dependent oxidoreductase [Chloroflexota bacterium]
MSELATLQETEYLYLTTTGRATGLRRRVELWYALEQGQVYLLAGAREHGGGSNWYRNGLADPRVEVEIGGGRWQGAFEPLGEGETERLLALFHRKYGEVTVRRWYRGVTRFPVRVALEKPVTD